MSYDMESGKISINRGKDCYLQFLPSIVKSFFPDRLKCHANQSPPDSLGFAVTLYFNLPVKFLNVPSPGELIGIHELDITGNIETDHVHEFL